MVTKSNATMTKEKKVKEPIKVRQKRLSNGGTSLYLDIYVGGKRWYEFLKLYLIPERTREDKERNRQTLQLANSVKAKRIVEIQNGEFGFKNGKDDANFYEYFVAMVKKRHGEESMGNWGNWRSCLMHMQRYDRHLKKRTFAEIDRDWIIGFHDYLDGTDSWNGAVGYRKEQQPLARNSRVSYFNKLRCCLNTAYDQGVISKNPMVGIEGFKGEEGVRMYLTVEELKRLVDTPCRDEDTRRAFLFSCLTGLRRSDIERLTWADVHKQGDYTRIIFRQKKTKGQEYLDINEEAEKLMGERGEADEHMFFLHCPEYTNHIIRIWCSMAGIDKDITFHCGRHTFATMMLDIGTDIYTVSKLLGHKELSTTQIYAKVMDKNKQMAVSKIPKIIDI